MMLKELTAVPDTALPLAAFRTHLRLGTGFADPGAEDVALSGYLRAAIATIEGRTAKVLLARDFSLSLEHWREVDRQPLPVAPVGAVTAVRVSDAAGAVTTVPATAWRLVRDGARPRLVAVAGSLPRPPSGGGIEIDFTAGYGAGWADLPADLAQAVMLLAAQYYEFRHEGGFEGAAMPLGVLALIERWRTVRVLGGSRGRP